MFAPGDLVQCVDAGPKRFDLAPPIKPIHMLLATGRHYRVAAVNVTRRGNVGISLVGISLPEGMRAFSSYRFRKIGPASDSFTEEMRACKPRVSAFDRCRTPLVLAGGDR